MMAVGGTGGHIYPAVALADQIHARDPSVEVLFAGGHLKNNPFFNQLGLPYKSITCAPFNSLNPIRLGSSLSLNIQGVYESVREIRRYAPSIIVGFGSYHSLPTLVAAKLCAVPVILFAADSHPGKVIRLFSGFSVATAVQFEEAAAYLKGCVHVVNMPLRKGMRNHAIAPSTARQYYGLDGNTTTMLVFGGSQGAAAINQAVLKMIASKGPSWSHRLQVIHIAGKEAFCSQLQQAYHDAGIKACIKPFEERMDLAWQACDFVLSRAGAASMAEQIEFEKPAILIPYPFASENHQEKNGHVMKNRIGAADVIVERELCPERLEASISRLLDDHGRTMQQMRAALQHFKSTRQALDFSEWVLKHT